jgi:hypothetical protein
MREFKYLTKKDSENICQASCDLESGNYLIRERTEEQLRSINELLNAIHLVSKGNVDDRLKEIVEWHKACSDFYYARDNGYLDENDHFIEIKWKEE